MKYALCKKYRNCKDCPRSTQCDAELLGLQSDGKKTEGKKYKPKERKFIYIPINFRK